MPAGHHQRIQPPCPLFRHQARRVGQTGDAAPGKGKLFAGHLDGALVEIGAEHVIHRVLQIAIGFQVIRQRPVAKAGLVLGLRDMLVDMDVTVARRRRQEAEDFRQRIARAAPGQKLVRGDKRAGIDEGVARSALFQFQKQDRIEARSRGLAPDPGPDLFPDPAQNAGQREDLGNRLDREPLPRIPGADHGSIGKRHGNAELRRIDTGEFGDVIGHPAPIRAVANLAVELGQEIGKISGHAGIFRRQAYEQLSRRKPVWETTQSYSCVTQAQIAVRGQTEPRIPLRRMDHPAFAAALSGSSSSNRR